MKSATCLSCIIHRCTMQLHLCLCTELSLSYLAADMSSSNIPYRGCWTLNLQCAPAAGASTAGLRAGLLECRAASMPALQVCSSILQSRHSFVCHNMRKPLVDAVDLQDYTKYEPASLLKASNPGCLSQLWDSRGKMQQQPCHRIGSVEYVGLVREGPYSSNTLVMIRICQVVISTLRNAVFCRNSSSHIPDRLLQVALSQQ